MCSEAMTPPLSFRSCVLACCLRTWPKPTHYRPLGPLVLPAICTSVWQQWLSCVLRRVLCMFAVSAELTNVVLVAARACCGGLKLLPVRQSGQNTRAHGACCGHVHRHVGELLVSAGCVICLLSAPLGLQPSSIYIVLRAFEVRAPGTLLSHIHNLAAMLGIR